MNGSMYSVQTPLKIPKFICGENLSLERLLTPLWKLKLSSIEEHEIHVIHYQF